MNVFQVASGNADEGEQFWENQQHVTVPQMRNGLVRVGSSVWLVETLGTK